jgi:hypothetical protein
MLISLRDIKSYWKIFRCHSSGKHKVEIAYLVDQKLLGCRTCDLWRYIPE